MKKIIYSLLIIFSLFLFNSNVFATDLDGNNTTEEMPPFLKEFYTISTSEATCNDYISGYCNLYSHLEQFFSEFHSLYKRVLVFGSAIPPTGQSYYSIYFFFDTPYINKTDYSNLGKENDIHLYDEEGNALKYYKITFRYSGLIDENITSIDKDKVIKSSIDISYHYEVENFTYVSLGYDERASCKGILSNFDLYSTNKQLYHSSDVKNWTYADLKSKTGLMLIPKKNTKFSSYFSYNNSNTYVSWYDINKKSTVGYKLLDKPVTDSLSYYINYTDDRLNKYNFIIYNKSKTETRVGYIAEDFNIVVFTDLYSSAIGSDGKRYDNPLSDLDKDINNDIVFSSDKSILENIVSFFTHFGDFLTNLQNEILSGIKKILIFLFVPSEEFLTDWLDLTQKQVEKQFGFLSYPFTWTINFLNKFTSLTDTGSYVISWPDIKVPNFNYNIISSGSYDLATLLNDPTIKSFHDLYFLITDALFLLAFFNLCINTYNRVFGGSQLENDYSSTTTSYNINEKTGEVTNSFHSTTSAHSKFRRSKL